MGAVVIDYINTAHDAVKYCTNTPNRYKLPWIKCLFIYTFLVIYWESNMGPYHRISVNYDHNAVKYCIDTAKWHKWQKTEYFLAFFQFFLQFEFLYHRLGKTGACQKKCCYSWSMRSYNTENTLKKLLALFNNTIAN